MEKNIGSEHTHLDFLNHRLTQSFFTEFHEVFKSVMQKLKETPFVLCVKKQCISKEFKYIYSGCLMLDFSLALTPFTLLNASGVIPR